jgi:peroxiredoxin/mono/diheme cytochrome c family protein
MHATLTSRWLVWIIFAASVIALLLLSSTAAGGDDAHKDNTQNVGQAVSDFALEDTLGAAHRLRDYANSKAVVVAFLGIECPLVKLYAPRLEKIAAEYRERGVTFLAIDSNSQDSLAELQHFVRTYGLTFPVLKDPGNVVADQFQAVRTPEMFVLDSDHKIRYRGRIDDQYGFQKGVGYQRPEASQNELLSAIESVIAGEEVAVASTAAPGCLIGRVSSGDAKTDITYSNQVARIFQNHCVSCHREGEIAPFALSSYEEAAGWAPMISEVILAGRMPPWHADPKHGDFANDARLPDEDKEMILAWAKGGAPEGDPSDLPPPRTFTSGWQIPTPDQVLPMADKPFVVPAEGKVEYQYFTADPGWTEDKWISAAECRAGNRAVVHHIIVFIIPPGEDPRPEAEGMSVRELLAGTAPGNPPTVLPTGMAKRVKAGSKLMFQMHYTANGREQSDLSSIGFVFADPATVTRDVKTDLAINVMFEVPAGADNHKVEAWRRFRQDSLLISLMPHMHLRGKAFRYELEYPDGRKEVLLDIPNYDFNWQNSYYFKEPKFVPRGAKMHCIAHFDNSEENLANPDPSQPVRWGEQTWEEMMIGWFVRAPAQEGADPDERRPANERDDDTDKVSLSQ